MSTEINFDPEDPVHSFVLVKLWAEGDEACMSVDVGARNALGAQRRDTATNIAILQAAMLAIAEVIEEADVTKERLDS